MLKCSSRGTQTQEALRFSSMALLHPSGAFIPSSVGGYAKIIEILSHPLENDLLLSFMPFITLSFDAIYEFYGNLLSFFFSPSEKSYFG